MVRRAALVALVASGVVLACSTFSSSDDTARDAGAEGGDDGATPPPAPLGDAGGAPIACDGGPPDLVHVVATAAPIDHIATDGLYMYWRTVPGHLARTRVDDGGTPEPLVDEAGPPAAIALTAADLYYIDGTQLTFVPKTGGTMPARVTYANSVSTLATSADHAYVGLAGGIRWVVEGATVAADIRTSIPGPTAIAVANDTLAYLDNEADAGGKLALFAGPASSYAIDPVLAHDTGGTTLLAGDGTTFYWARNSSVWTITRDAGAATVLVDEPQPIGALVADEKAVVYATAAGVKLYDRARRCFAVVTTDPSPALALTSTDLFFVRGTSEIVRARR